MLPPYDDEDGDESDNVDEEDTELDVGDVWTDGYAPNVSEVEGGILELDELTREGLLFWIVWPWLESRSKISFSKAWTWAKSGLESKT